jgi:hypothetical protein
MGMLLRAGHGKHHSSEPETLPSIH